MRVNDNINETKSEITNVVNNKKQQQGEKKSKIATVVSNKKQHEGTIVVEMTYTLKHKKYQKVQNRRTRLQVHYENKNVNMPLGTKVHIFQCRPMSKTKRWIIGDKVC